MKSRTHLMLAIILTLFMGMSVNSYALDFESIRNNMNNMTDLQWDDYTESLKGRRLSGCGYVTDVDKQFFGGYKVLVDMDPPGTFSVQDIYLEDVPKSTAYGLNKGDNICYNGKIKSIHNILGSCAISLEYK